MSFHTLIEHLPYARRWPCCVGNQSWIKHVPWPPWEAHQLVGETDMHINNYNVLQRKKITIAIGKIQVNCFVSQRRGWFIPQKDIGKRFITEVVLKHEQVLALSRSKRKGTPDNMGKCVASPHLNWGVNMSMNNRNPGMDIAIALCSFWLMSPWPLSLYQRESQADAVKLKPQPGEPMTNE